MRHSSPIPPRPYQPAPFAARLREISMFFDGTDRVHETMRRVCAWLDAAGVRYAIVGGMAVNAYGHRRTTEDVDFLLSQDGFRILLDRLGSTEFERVPGRARRLLDRATGITFDVLVTGLFPGNGNPGPVAYPDPATISHTIEGRPVVDLATLIQLKLAASRYQDFADVVNLIAVQNLDESFADKLDASLRGDYIECLEEKRREDEYEHRQDQATNEISS